MILPKEPRQLLSNIVLAVPVDAGSERPRPRGMDKLIADGKRACATSTTAHYPLKLLRYCSIRAARAFEADAGQGSRRRSRGRTTSVVLHGWELLETWLNRSLKNTSPLKSSITGLPSRC